MRENRQSGSEGGEPQTNAAFLPLSIWGMTICSSSNPVYRPSGPLGLNDALGNRGLRPRQRIYQPSGLRTALVDLPQRSVPDSGSPVEIRLFGFSPEGGTSLPVCVSLMALTLVKFRETRSDWHDICATNLELLNSA
jgi:hypothetical protein